MAALLLRIACVAIVLTTPVVRSQSPPLEDNYSTGGSPMAPLAAALGLPGLATATGAGGPPGAGDFSSLPLTYDGCVARCANIQPPQHFSQDMMVSTMLPQYCANMDCLRGYKSQDGQQSCLDKVLNPSLQKICQLDTAAKQRCIGKISRCQQMERQNMIAIQSITSNMRQNPAHPQSHDVMDVTGISTAISMQSTILNGICDDYKCIEEAANECEVGVDHLQALSTGVLSFFAGSHDQYDTQMVTQMPGSLYCCLPRLYEVYLSDCIPGDLDYILEKKDVLEPIFGSELVIALSDSLRDIKTILQQWGKQINDPNYAQSDKEEWLKGLKIVYNRFQRAIEQANLSPGTIERRLQDPKLLKPLLRTLCDLLVKQHSCVISSLKDVETCDAYWPYTKKSYLNAAGKMADVKAALEQMQSQGQGPDVGGSLAVFTVVEWFLEECPAESLVSRVEEASGYTSAGTVQDRPAVARLLLYTVLGAATGAVLL